MLPSTPDPTSLPTDEIEAIAATAVREIRERHAIVPGTARDREIADEAAFLCACHLEDADRDRLDADGVAAAIYPAGFWERVAAPFVAAVLDRTPPIPNETLPVATADGLRAALNANGGRLEGDLADVVRAVQRHTARLAREG